MNGYWILGFGVAALFLLYFLQGQKQGYGYFPPKYSTYMRKFYDQAQSGTYSQEYQELCELQHGARCALSTGTSGICGLNGKCTSFHGNNNSHGPLPLPYSSGDCPIYCRNHTSGEESEMRACIEDCQKNYYPDGF